MTDMEYGLYGLLMVSEAAAILLAYVYFYRPAAKAAWRQELFEVRNRLWDEMRRLGRLDSPAHVELRDRINGMIVTADYINLWFFLFAPMPSRRPEPTLAELVRSEPNPEVQRAMESAQEKLIGLVAMRLMVWTMPGMVFGLPLCVFFLCRKYLKRLIRPASQLIGLSPYPDVVARWSAAATERTETRVRSRSAAVNHLAHC